MKRFTKVITVMSLAICLCSQMVYSADTIKDSSELTVHDVDELLFIREEEKLARDVYLVFYEKWHLEIFNNISKSEQKHMDGILTLLNQYGIEDPVVDNDVGIYSNETLTALYKELIFWGMKSKVDAILVGVFIEEFDSIDLEHAMEHTLVDEIDKVYESLCEGSYNHLESYIYVYERQTSDIFEQLVLRDTLTLVINEIEEDLGDIEEAAISQHEIYSDEKIEEFLANMSDGPGKFTQGKKKNIE